MPLGTAGPGWFMVRNVERRQSDRGRQEKLPLCSEAEKSAEIVLGIPNGMRAFALSNEIVFDQTVKRGKRLVVLFERALLRIRTLKRLRQHADSGLEIFADGWREGWGKLVIKLGEQHGKTLIQNFFVIYRHQNIANYIRFCTL